MAVTKSRGRSFLVGVGLIAFAVLISYVALTAPDGRPLSRHTEVRAAFTDVGQLQPGDDVRQNSKRIGQVSDIEFRAGTAVVTLRLNGEREVYADARAAMWDQSALGQKFVELDPGTSTAGGIGDAVIPTRRTTSAMDIDQVLDVFDPRTRKALGGTVRELGTGVAGRSKALAILLKNAPAELDDLSAVATALTSADADLAGLLQSSRSLAARLSSRSADLRSLTRATETTLRALDVDRGSPLETTIANLPSALTEVREVSGDLDQPLRDLRSAVTRLRPGAVALGEATPATRSLLRGGVQPLEKVPGVSAQAVPAVEELTGVVRVAQPVVPRVRTLVAALSPFLRDLAPYAVDIPALADGGASFTNAPITDENGLVYNHVLIFPVIDYSILGGLIAQGYNPYPKPGTATKDGSDMSSYVGLLGEDR